MKLKFDYSSPEAKLTEIRKKTVLLSLSRLLLFMVILGVLVVGLSGTYWLTLLFFPLSFLFIFLILKFNDKKDQEQFLKAILDIHLDTKKRSQRELNAFDQGLEFINKKHPYAIDLDLFGTHSLFQLINHTVSPGGKNKLANCMMHLLNPEAAKQKNKAIVELSSKKDFLLSFEALGKAFLKNEKSKRKLYEWLKRPLIWKSWYFLPMIAGPTGGLIILIGVLFGLLPTYFFSLFIFIGLIMLGLVFKPLLDAAKAMPDDGDLKTYYAWSQLLEEESFTEDFLLAYQRPFKDDKILASKALK
ncbi:MAG: hypothetical protein WDZ72_12705 [Cyclobacteriaceae bacterium]